MSRALSMPILLALALSACADREEPVAPEPVEDEQDAPEPVSIIRDDVRAEAGADVFVYDDADQLTARSLGSGDSFFGNFFGTGGDGAPPGQRAATPPPSSATASVASEYSPVPGIIATPRMLNGTSSGASCAGRVTSNENCGTRLPNRPRSRSSNTT